MLSQIQHYFADGKNVASYLRYLLEHLNLSAQALLLSLVIGLPLGYICHRHPFWRNLASNTAQALRVIPSIGVLFILIPFMGVGRGPALVALVLLGLPPILLNTVLGFVEVPPILLETGRGIGMSPLQLLKQVSFPLAMPYILTGIKLALVEIIASATLATYIGAGGLGTLIFTGLGLYRLDLLLIGGFTVTLLSFISVLVFDLSIKGLSRR